MGKGKILLPPLDESIEQASDDNKNDEIKPGLIPVKSHENGAHCKDANQRGWLFALVEEDSKADHEKSEEEVDLKKKK